MVEFRDATPEDAAEMARIQSTALREFAGEEYTENQLSYLAPEPDPAMIPEQEFEAEPCKPVVATAGETIVGWGTVHLDEGSIGGTFVDPDHAGQGIGHEIVERLESIARDGGVDRLTVRSSLNAVAFYESLGFERLEEVDAGGPKTVTIPAIKMEKQL